MGVLAWTEEVRSAQTRPAGVSRRMTRCLDVWCELRRRGLAQSRLRREPRGEGAFSAEAGSTATLMHLERAVQRRPTNHDRCDRCVRLLVELDGSPEQRVGLEGEAMVEGASILEDRTSARDAGNSRAVDRGLRARRLGLRTGLLRAPSGSEFSGLAVLDRTFATVAVWHSAIAKWYASADLPEIAESRSRMPRCEKTLPGHALRRRKRFHRRYPCRLLGSGGAAAPERESLALLPSGPDAVRTLPVRGTRSSTPRAQTLSRRTVPRTAFGPAWSGFRVQGTADSPPSVTGQAGR